MKNYCQTSTTAIKNRETLWEAAKKSYVLCGWATKRGRDLLGLGLLTAWGLGVFFFNIRKKVPMATKPRGGPPP